MNIVAPEPGSAAASAMPHPPYLIGKSGARSARFYELHDHIIETFQGHVVAEDAIKEWT